MNDNVFAAPEQDVVVAAGDRQLFPDMSYKEVKKLRNNSSTISTLGVLWILAGVFYPLVGIFLIAEGREEAVFGGILVAAGLLSLVSGFGMLRRPEWGRPMGMITSAISLIGFPVGTLFGVIGLIALASSASLFGPGRLPHGDLNREYKYRRKNKID